MSETFGQIEKVSCWRSGTSPKPILNITFLFSPIRLLIAGAWPQNCKILLQRNVARVKIATGPAFVLGRGSNGVCPDHWPRLDVGSRKMVQVCVARSR